MSEIALEKPKTTRITAADINAALRQRYAQPEWAIFFEVRNAAGFDANRSADAVAMSLWPSRGLEFHGFEVKVSRSDWRREIEKPEKAEAIAAYCDRWWVVSPPDIVPVHEIPPAWGYLTWDGKRWRCVKDAEKTEAKAISRTFMAALMRRAAQRDKLEIDALVDAKDKARNDAFNERLADAVKWRTREHETLKEAVAAFEKSSGVSIAKMWGAGDIGAAVKLVQSFGIERLTDSFSGLIAVHERAAAQLREAIAEYSADANTEKQKATL